MRVFHAGRWTWTTGKCVRSPTDVSSTTGPASRRVPPNQLGQEIVLNGAFYSAFRRLSPHPQAVFVQPPRDIGP